MGRILRMMKRYWAYYALGFTVMGVSIFLDMVNPVVVGRLIDEVIVARDRGVFPTLVLWMAGIALGRSVLVYVKELSFDYGGALMVGRIRQELFDHIQGLSYSFFDEKNTGELMARVKDDAEKIWFASSFGIMLGVEALATLVVATVLMFRISPRLSILALVAIPLLGGLAWALERTIGAVYGEISEKNAQLNAIAQENIAGVRLVKAFGREKHEIAKFLSHNEGYYDLNLKQARIWSRFYPKIEGLSGILPILVITLGGVLVVGETLSIGTLVKFSSYMYLVVWPMRMVGWITNTLAEAVASARKIEEVHGYAPTIRNPEAPVKLRDFSGEVSFEDVSLELGGTQVLEGVSFRLGPGKTLGIIGSTGSGKSSIVNLLSRFVDCTGGSVTFDGVDIRKLDLKNLREQVAVVMQEVFLFSDTIEENIRLGNREEAGWEALQPVAAIAQAHEFIARMEHQQETVIGEKGIGLSGGQKQRIGIARALAKKSKVLVLDDATSSLDMETEHRIQKEVERLEGVGKIIIAHRISAVRRADEILVLEKGRVVERGTHQELMDQRGRYCETFREQYEEAMYADQHLQRR
ncbi:ABC transporter ATP-binding protein [Anaerotalea alkaliphila]|uniref:ABC transporter ATP-binding protein n=1 Tax=Anaerotalea alkaliphila TaxID=2662126 RepID=A0A7X5KNG0_9FIRM|nr:ABC transporter ATP-binding protein [Anaerotalea alkaliphila]NDL66722.1 ABC transporter ATP-binding protein [Anaerotalea alkaliphila]